jgi:hypothetical protein
VNCSKLEKRYKFQNYHLNPFKHEMQSYLLAFPRMFILINSLSWLEHRIYSLLSMNCSQTQMPTRYPKTSREACCCIGIAGLTLIGIREGTFHPQSFMDQKSAEFLAKLSELFWR